MKASYIVVAGLSMLLAVPSFAQVAAPRSGQNQPQAEGAGANPNGAAYRPPVIGSMKADGREVPERYQGKKSKAQEQREQREEELARQRKNGEVDEEGRE